MFKVQAHDRRTVSWWNSRRNEIDFSPPYQRKGNVWSESAKAYLVDSIINDYDIPKIYLADFSFGNTSLNVINRRYAVIDGKQRLEAIIDFVGNKFPLRQDFVFEANPLLSLGGLFYKDLKETHSEVADRFDQFNLDVMSVITDDEAKINDLFIRLNSSKPLTAPEFRNAMKGVVPKQISAIAKHDFFRTRVRFSTKRGEDKAVAAKLLLLEFRGKIVDTKKTQIDRLVDEGVKAESPGFEKAASRVNAVLGWMEKVFVPRDVLLSSQGPLTVYYQVCRQTGPVPGLREKFVRFNELRQKNKEKVAEGLPGDHDLSNFDMMARNTNDSGSIRLRTEILLRYLGK
ncbi:DUF262 domain-containing protein [Arenimonas terrae]|uniref:DUF262 domain-containing protein n=1 Tax=Arenimonas terrae TaxID=2546226 RepID=A0A5C4RV60_9GAMM|nr:DUF262 domain-containing protein [Arenimonas terrae]TNJ34835.1 DUF262 domain-containing protein [Arenimonas terrae]